MPSLIHCFIWSQIYCDKWSQIHSYQLHFSKCKSTVSSETISTATSIFPANHDCQRGESEHVWAVRPSMSEFWEHSQIQSVLPAHSECRFSATSEAISTITSLPVMPDLLLPAQPVSPLPAKPDPPLPACSHWSHIHGLLPALSESRFSATSEATSTSTSVLPIGPHPLLPAKPVSPPPAKLDPPYQLALTKAGVSERWEWACPSGETKHVRAMKETMSQL